MIPHASNFFFFYCTDNLFGITLILKIKPVTITCIPGIAQWIKTFFKIIIPLVLTSSPTACFTDGRQLLLYLSSDFNICAYSGWFEPKMFNLDSFATYYQFSSCLWHTSTFSPCFPSLKLASDSHPSTETLSDECLVNSWRAYRIFAVLYYYLWLLFIPIFNNIYTLSMPC